MFFMFFFFNFRHGSNGSIHREKVIKRGCHGNYLLLMSKWLLQWVTEKLKCWDEAVVCSFINTYWRSISTSRAGVRFIEYVAIKLDKFHNRQSNTKSSIFQITRWCCKFGHFINFQLLCCWRLRSGLNGKCEKQLADPVCRN